MSPQGTSYDSDQLRRQAWGRQNELEWMTRNDFQQAVLPTASFVEKRIEQEDE